jgi:hypothetical protein
MPCFGIVLSLILAVASPHAFAWGNHSFSAYRTFEAMPEVANAASVKVEPLDAFLRAEEKTIEALLASQEAWAVANLEKYPARPAPLAFTANTDRPDEARRLAFLMALRVALNSKFALYIQPDPQTQPAPNTLLPHAAVNTLPEQPNSVYTYVGLKAGEPWPFWPRLRMSRITDWTSTSGKTAPPTGERSMALAHFRLATPRSTTRHRHRFTWGFFMKTSCSTWPPHS